MSTSRLEGLAEAPRVRWAITIRLLLAFFALAWLITISLLSPPASGWVLALIVYITLRATGDLAEALAGERPGGSLLEAILKASSWGFIPLGAQWVFFPGETAAPVAVWMTGLMILLFGVGLAAHHDRARRRTPRIAHVAAVSGLGITIPGAGLAATGLPFPPAWRVPAALLTAIIVLVLAYLARPRKDEGGTEPAGWTGWWRHHRMRFTILAVLVAAYLPARRFIADEVGGFLIIWEYLGAVTIAGFLFWSLRTHLDAMTRDAPVSSPHRKHEPDIKRVSDAELDAWEDAFGAFLLDGDVHEVHALAKSLEAQERVPARRLLEPLLSYRAPRGILLVSPVWLYAAALGSILLLFAALTHFANALAPLLGEVALLFPVIALAAGLYMAQFNRFGGPWWMKSLIAYLGLSTLPFLAIPLHAAGLPGPVELVATPVGLAVAFILVIVPLLHATRGRRARQHAEYLYLGDDPLGAVEVLTKSREKSLAARAVWAAIIALPVFLITGELAQQAPALASLVPLYLLFAAIIIIHPLLVVIGLRLGRAHIARIASREARERARRHETAVDALAHALRARPQPPGTET